MTQTSVSADEARRRIRAAGLRATGPRVAVYRTLARADRPLAHTEVVERIGAAFDQASIYRVLVRFAADGLARIASTARGIKRYELATDDGHEEAHVHPHFVCLDCGTVECLPEAVVKLPGATAGGAVLAEVEVQVSGHCARCV